MIKSTANLFEQQKICKHTDPATSYGAAEKVVSSGLQNKWHEKILGVLALRPDYTADVLGWTAKEIASELSGGNWHGSYYEVSKRMRELVDGLKVFIVCSQRYSQVGGGQAQAYQRKL
jgi:hypothetical protein